MQRVSSLMGGGDASFSFLGGGTPTPGGGTPRANSRLSYAGGNIHKPFTTTMQVGKNVGKVRWLQSQGTQMIPDPFAPEYFVWTSCGEKTSDICLWGFKATQDAEGRMTGSLESVDKVMSPSTVTDVVAINDFMFATTTADGTAAVYKCIVNTDRTYDHIQHVSRKQLHTLRDGLFPSPARAVTTNGTSIVTVGEDGSIFELDVNTFKVGKSFERTDLSIYCVDYVSRSEIITGNGGGQLKVWDLKGSENKPVQVMNPNVVMNNIYGAISIAIHPSQRHLVIVGYQSGCMDLYDLRMGSECDPIANLANDGGSVSELYFHQINPDHFFSCSQSGQLCHWYPGTGTLDMQDNLDYTPDVNIEFLKRGLLFKQLHSSFLPINSLNLSKHDRLIAAGDSGVMFCTEISTHS